MFQLAATIFGIAQEERLHRKNCVLCSGRIWWAMGVVVLCVCVWGGGTWEMEGGGMGDERIWEKSEMNRRDWVNERVSDGE